MNKEPEIDTTKAPTGHTVTPFNPVPRLPPTWPNMTDPKDYTLTVPAVESAKKK